MTDPITPAPLSQLGLSQEQCKEFSSLVRVLATYLNQLSIPEMSEKKAKEVIAKYEAQEARLEEGSLSDQKQKAYLISSLTADKRALEAKLSQLELLLAGIRSDISKTQLELTKLDAVMSYLTNDFKRF